MSSPASLRDTYHAPHSGWSFQPAPPPSSTSSSPSHPDLSSAPSYNWSRAPPPPNSIFDLSPSLSLGEPSTMDLPLLLKASLAAAFLQYTSAALVMPWEVSKTLLQVQWVPRDIPDDREQEEDVTQTPVDEQSDESSNEDESYFTDPSASASQATPRLASDDRGYIIRRSVTEDSTRPVYIIPVGSVDGVWNMMRRIGTFRSEGWLALFKGLLTSFIADCLAVQMQPALQTILTSIFVPSLTTFQQPPLLLPLSAHLLTGFILSPLDLVRTRLIVQSYSAKHASYTGPINALSHILRDEGGIKGVYLHPHLLIPTLLDTGLRPLVSLALPHVAALYLGHVSPQTHPFAWGLAEFIGSAVGLVLTLPFETVRRRLQAQTRGTAPPLRACVELRPRPYNGVVDVLWHVLTEERSDLPITRPPARRQSSKGKGKRKEGATAHDAGDLEEGGWLRRTGIGQLYRGFGMRLGASAVVFVLRMISGMDSEPGWAEL